MKFEYGKPISEKLSQALRDHITKNDIADISINSNVSASTIRDVIYRTNSVTENNEGAIVLTVQRALENCKRTKQKFIRQNNYLTKVIR